MGDERAGAYRIPIYLIRDHIATKLPPEQRYSTIRGPGAELVGHVVSEHPLIANVEGAAYEHPDMDVKGPYSTRSLIICSTSKLYDLQWEKAE